MRSRVLIVAVGLLLASGVSAQDRFSSHRV